MGRGEYAETSARDRGGESIADVVIIGGPLTCLNVETFISGVKQQEGWCRPMKGRSRLSVKDVGYVSPRSSAIVPGPRLPLFPSVLRYRGTEESAHLA